MKPRDVQRAVKSQRFGRSAGDAPSIGRVARVPGTGMPREIRRKRRRGELSGTRDLDARSIRVRLARRRVIIAWSSLFLFLVCAAFAVILWSWLRGQMNRNAAISATPEAPEIQTRVVSRFPSPSEDEALRLVKQALAIRDEAAIPMLFRTGTATPKQVLAFLTERSAQDGPIIGYEWLSSMDANNLLIDGVVVNTQLSDKPRNRLALLTPDAHGIWKIDFDAYARTVEPPWPVLLDPQTREGMVRVVTARDSYFNGPFRNEDEWTCFGMASPDMDEILLGYCRRGTPQADALERIVKKSEDAAELSNRNLCRATLVIRRNDGAERRQFEITRVLAEDWIVSDTAFDGLPL
jgi:hypothetical protein